MTATDYHRVEAALALIAERWADQPSLEEIAAAARLSPHHFQRTFRRWAGISPKRFLQHVTASHAREMLSRGAPVLETAHAVGLSGPGRLHDLCVSVEAATPGDIGTRGRGLTVRTGMHASPFGDAFVGVTERGVCALAFCGEEGDGPARARLARAWPAARFVEDQRATRGVVEHLRRASRGARSDRPLTLLLTGTNFQIRVWQALLSVPAGSVTTYGRLAEAVGSPRAARAVGTAVGANPIAWLIPCHRVLRESGALGGYRWGEARKAALLGWEGTRGSAAG